MYGIVGGYTASNVVDPTEVREQSMCTVGRSESYVVMMVMMRVCIIYNTMITVRTILTCTIHLSTLDTSINGIIHTTLAMDTIEQAR